MKKIFMLLMCAASVNSFGLSSPSSLLKLETNQDGYKIKFVADLTNIKQSNDWFPNFYNYDTKSENDDLYTKEDITIKDNKVYRLLDFKRYDKYINNLSDDTLLYLCKTTLDGNSNWSCQVIGDGKNPDNLETQFIQSSDNDQLVMKSKVLKPDNLIFYNPNTKSFSYKEFPRNYYGFISGGYDFLDSNTYTYYANGIFYTSGGQYLDFINKRLYSSNMYSIKGNCYEVTKGYFYSLGDKYYAFDGDGSIFHVDFSPSNGFIFGEQLGERNAAISHLQLPHQEASADGKLFFLAENKSNIPPQGKIYYVSETANKNTGWKTLTIKSTSNDYYAQRFSSLKLYSTDNRIFFSILTNTGTLKSRLSLYEITK